MSNPSTSERPDLVKDEHLVYLDDLRDSGATNMFGAGSYLQEVFGLDKRASRTILAYWMQSIGDRLD